ncbi:MAG: ABC transporter permease [Chloroflexi bacterium]|nr:MAG: ABC transporter permease [Chloroflexota bacterium]
MRFIVRRLGFYLVAAWVSITVNFFLPRMMAGDPVQLMFARFQGRLDPRALDSLYATFGFVRGSLWVQYVTYLQHLFRGEMGLSISNFPVPVSQVIMTSLGWTIRLLTVALIFSVLLGTFLGMLAAWKRGKFVDNFILPASSLLNSFPYFWLAMLAVYTLALGRNWFPLGHAASVNISKDWTNWEYIRSVIHHATLPALTIVLTSLGGWLVSMRSSMISVLSQDYIVLAEAKGLSNRRVMVTYAARNAILPTVTGFAMALAFIIGGAFLTEIVFSYPGMGYSLITAVNTRDYPLMQGIFLLITFTVLAANLIVDIVYVFLDPRVRYA